MKKIWWQRCITAAFLNGAVWITPPPLHMVSLLMPFFSGYMIALDRPSKGFIPSVQIGLVMGAVLGLLALIPGLLLVLFISMFISIEMRLWAIIVTALGAGIGLYTAGAACLGAFVAVYRDARSTPRS